MTSFIFSNAKMSFRINDNPLKKIFVPLQEITNYGDDSDNDGSCDHDNDENEKNIFDELF